MMVGDLVMVVHSPLRIVSPRYITVANILPGHKFFCVGVNDKHTAIQIIYEEGLAQITERGAVVCVKNEEFLKGYRICMTGSTRLYTKSSMKLIIESLGGEVVASPKKATHILRGAIERSLKLEYAAQEGIPVLRDDEFMNLVKPAIILL